MDLARMQKRWDGVQTPENCVDFLFKYGPCPLLHIDNNLPLCRIHISILSLSQTQLRMLVVAWIWDHFGEEHQYRLRRQEQTSDEIYWVRQ